MKSGFIAIIGRPNAGKSTLLNALLGTQVSIVTPKAQTTRERVLGILTEAGEQIIFIDTPGIHKARAGGINEFMVSEASEALEDPSAIWYLVDPSSRLDHEGEVLRLLERSDRATPIFMLMSKWDLKGYRYSLEQAEKLEGEVKAALLAMGFTKLETARISSEKGKGTDELLAKAKACLPEHPFYYPDEEQLSDRPTKFFVAEKVREQLFHQLGDELPYSCAVEIEKFNETAKPPRIEAVIHVERDSQKGMVIGKGGQKIKEIGTQARAAVEEFLGHPVFLGLKVNVLKDWTRDAENLKKLGYLLPDRKGARK